MVNLTSLSSKGFSFIDSLIINFFYQKNNIFIFNNQNKIKISLLYFLNYNNNISNLNN